MPVTTTASHDTDSDHADSGYAPEPRWRAALRVNPVTNLAYRVVVAVVGLVVVVAGLVMVPLAGPGWVVVLLGVAVWATEFEWAHRLKTWGTARLREWTAWIGRQPLWVRGLIGLATFCLVTVVMVATVWFTGIPSWVPDVVEDPVVDLMRRYLPAR